MWINIFQTSVQMMGGGILHGQGEVTWKTKKPGDNAFPDSVVFTQCKSSGIENINIVNSKGFNLKSDQSDGFKANLLNISCAEDSSNTDGINIGKIKDPVIVDEKGIEIEGECSGYLCIKGSWPGAFRTLYGDHDRYETTYFKPFPGYYFSGDGCRRDKDGYHWLTGRVDDVINVSGHRIGSAEVESDLVSHPQCAEAAIVGVEHEVKGQGIYAFVTLVDGVPYSEELRKSLVLAV